jgi:hypothetical protein
MGALAAVLVGTLALSGCPWLVPARPFDGATHASYYEERWSQVRVLVPGLVPPDVEPVEIVPDDTWLDTVLECVARYGQGVGRRVVFEISELICEQQYPSTGGVELARTAADRERTWRYYDRVMLTCLLLHGLPLLPSPAYREGLAGGRYLWRVNEPTAVSGADRYPFEMCPAAAE